MEDAVEIEKMKKQLADKNAKLKKKTEKLKQKTMKTEIENLKLKLREKDETLQKVITEYDEYWKDTNKGGSGSCGGDSAKQPLVKYKGLIGKKMD